MSLQAQVLYDFEPHPQSGEVALSVGDIVTVTRQNIGDGWWEGVNAAGDLGLFPGSYVQAKAMIFTFNTRKTALRKRCEDALKREQTDAALAEKRREIMRRHTYAAIALAMSATGGIRPPMPAAMPGAAALPNAAEASCSSNSNSANKTTQNPIPSEIEHTGFEERKLTCASTNFLPFPPAEADSARSASMTESSSLSSKQLFKTESGVDKTADAPQNTLNPPKRKFGSKLFSKVLAATISSPPSTLPPPLPPGIDDHQTSAAATNNGWGSSFANYENNPAPPPPPPNDDDEFADDWSDDEAPRQEHKQSRTHHSRPRESASDVDFHHKSAKNRHHHGNDDVDTDTNANDSKDENTFSKEESAGSEKAGGGHGGTGQWQVSRTGARTHSGGQPMEAGKGTVKKNINRFSNFVKSGTEAYILDSSRPSCQPREAIQVAVGSDGVFWASNPQAYTVRVDSPKKASKLKGLKSFIAYQLTPSFNNIQVSRRYKHFDWLHARLSEKFACLLIPPLPEKQVSGRYEEDFVGHRMQLLQVWIDKICRHPVLSQSAVWQHFITCTDEKKWKSGKRAAEKDEFVGGNLFLTVQIPHQPLDMMDVESRIEGFGRMARSLDESVKGFYTMAAEAAKKMQGPYKREYLKIGAAFRSLGLSFDLDISGGSADMTDAIKRAGDSYDIIAQMFEQQPRVDLEPLMAALFAYKGMLASVPEMIVTHKSALSKLRDHQKLADEGKVNQAELEAIRSRVDVISYALLAEINHFQREKVHDFGDMLSTFLRGQVAFYQEIVNKLQSTLQLYSNYA